MTAVVETAQYFCRQLHDVSPAAMVLQAEIAWHAAAAQLEALTKTHDGVLGQLREAQDRTQLAEQETIEVSPACMLKSAGTLSDVLAVSQGAVKVSSSIFSWCT